MYWIKIKNKNLEQNYKQWEKQIKNEDNWFKKYLRLCGSICGLPQEQLISKINQKHFRFFIKSYIFVRKMKSFDKLFFQLWIHLFGIQIPEKLKKLKKEYSLQELQTRNS